LARLYDWLNDQQRNLKIVGSRLNDEFNNAFSGIADLRTYGATASVSSLAAVNAAVAAGHKRLLLPTGFFYQGGGTGAEAGGTEIPAGVEIIGEDIQTSLIKAVDRTNSGVPGFIYLNKFSVLTNCGSQSYPGDQQTSPAATQKTVMQPRVANLGDAKATWVPWTGALLINMGANLTSPESVTSTDNPGYQVVQNSSGDAYYAGVAGGGVGYRADTYGNGDFGLLITNGFLNPSNIHSAIEVIEKGTNSAGFSVKVQRTTGSTSPLLLIKDDNASGVPATAFPFSLRTKDSAFGTNAQYLFAGDTTAIRIWTSGGGTFIEGIDAATGVSSYQPLTIGGSSLVFQFAGATVFQSITSSNLSIAAATTAKSSMRLAVGGPPTSPVDGDIWREDNTNTGLKIRVNGVTKTITLS